MNGKTNLPRVRAVWFLLCGILIHATTPFSHAQESSKLLNVNILQAKMSSAAIPDFNKPSPSGAVQVTPYKHWFWRFLEGLAIGAAKYNTEKEGDGRPYPSTNSR